MAEATLASALVTLNDLDRCFEGAIKRRRLGTGCSSIDEALDGGLVYGEEGIYNISTPPGNNTAETISLQLLITHLLSDESSPATVIDTSGTFDVLKLYKGIIQRLEKTADVGRESHDTMIKRATAMLDRVKIMRVFDFEGVVEGIGELSEDVNRCAQAENEAPKNTIGDSQEEEEDIADLTSTEETTVESRHEQQQQQRIARGMVIIDNLSQVMNVVLKNNYVQGQASLTDLTRMLRQMAIKHNLCVVLMSWSVTYRDDQERASVFAAIKSRPGLGKAFGYMVDTQMMVDMVPKESKDASEWVKTIEVLHSRGGHQEGKFGVFGIDDKGEIEDGI